MLAAAAHQSMPGARRAAALRHRGTTDGWPRRCHNRSRQWPRHCCGVQVLRQIGLRGVVKSSGRRLCFWVRSPTPSAMASPGVWPRSAGDAPRKAPSAVKSLIVSARLSTMANGRPRWSPLPITLHRHAAACPKPATCTPRLPPADLPCIDRLPVAAAVSPNSPHRAVGLDVAIDIPNRGCRGDAGNGVSVGARAPEPACATSPDAGRAVPAACLPAGAPQSDGLHARRQS